MREAASREKAPEEAERHEAAALREAADGAERHDEATRHEAHDGATRHEAEGGANQRGAGGDGAPRHSGADRHEGTVRSDDAARTVKLAALLAAAFIAALMLVFAVAGFAGFTIQSLGYATLEELVSPSAISAVIFCCAALLTAISCTLCYRLFVRPLRRMTAAMGELARGNFAFRLERRGRLNIREVDEFAESFNTAAAELASTEMMRAGFIGDFSHEFRTPINTLSGFAQLVREGGMPDEERDEYLDIIVEESRRLAGLSERILLLSKMEATSILPEVGPVDVAEQLRRAVALAEPKMAAKGLSVDLGLDGCTVEGSADYLAQLWANLIDNAVKFSPEGGRVGVALYGGRADEEDRKGADDEAVVWVSDEGCGMTAEVRSRIFDRFYQGDPSHTSQGSGLGLSLCKRIAELHGGTIGVQSAPGEGSIFEVRLPLRARGPLRRR